MLDAFVDYVGWCWTNNFFVKKKFVWKFKSVRTFIQHFVFHIGWCWVRFRAHPTWWTYIMEKKMSISIKFERLIVRMPIRLYCSFGQLFLSFYKIDSESGETVGQTKETIKNYKKIWIDHKSKIWLNCSRRNPVYGMFFVGLSFLWDHHQSFNHLCLYAMIASEDKTFKSKTIASNKRSYYNFIAFTKCWSNMSDTLTQTSPTC